jgi:hypothetical protein
MSTAYAIAGVSAVLQRLLTEGLSEHAVSSALAVDVGVSAMPTDQVDDDAHLNVFLYQVRPNLSRRNESLPSRNVHSQRLTNQPLALDLHYLISAHGGDDLFSEVLLGSAMQTLHEKPFFDRKSIRALLPTGGGDPLSEALANAGLADQLEQLTITPEYLSNEDMSKLWSALQSSYRPSATYLVTAVLIEAEKPSVSALPVLSRGITARPDLVPPTPTLMTVTYPLQQIAAHLNETITITGFNLNGPNVRAKLQKLNTEQVDDFPLLAGANNELVTFDLPNDATLWRAGVYSLSLIMDNATGDPIESNQLSLTIAPRFSAFNATRNPDNSLSVEITIDPEVTDTQSISLIIGQTQEIAEKIILPPLAQSIDTVRFGFPDIPAGNYWARVRVDGVDSLLIDRSTTPPEFFATQQVVVPA